MAAYLSLTQAETRASPRWCVYRMACFSFASAKTRSMVYFCNSAQREHDKKLNNGLPILHIIPPYRDCGRYFCIQAGKGGTMRPGLMKHQAHFLYPKQGKRLILGWMASTRYSFYNDW